MTAAAPSLALAALNTVLAQVTTFENGGSMWPTEAGRDAILFLIANADTLRAALQADPVAVGDAMAAEFKRLADSAYCEYARQMQTDDCLGADAKLAAGKFTPYNLQAIIESGRLLGCHQAYSRAATLLATAPPTDALPAAGAEVMVCQLGDYAPINRRMATVLFDDKKFAECYTDEDAEVVGAALRAYASKPTDEAPPKPFVSCSCHTAEQRRLCLRKNACVVVEPQDSPT